MRDDGGNRTSITLWASTLSLRWGGVEADRPSNIRALKLAQEYAPALELEAMLLTRRPEEIFAAEDETDWQEWVDFFRQTREPDRRCKGLVEIRL